MGFLSKLRTAVWGTRPRDAVERSLLMKQDCFILTYVCLIYWVNYLDRSNLSNAYVSGMKTDLNMQGNDISVLTTVFNVGYIVAMVPHNLILLKVRPRYWLTFCASAWGILTLSIYKVTSYKQVVIIRFFIAVFESVTFSGTHLILGTFYDEDLLPFRSAIFTSSGLVGSIISSVLQAAIYKHMDDYRGIRGWRWLFIIDFLITIPVVIFGLIFFPDLPEVGKAFYFTDAEHEASLRRRERTKPKESSFNWTVLKRVFGQWKWWAFSLLWVFGGLNEGFSSNSLFSLWLLHFKYPVTQNNYFPMGIYAIGIVTTLGSSIYINMTGGKNHFHVVIFISVAVIISAIMILADPLSKANVFAAYYIAGIAYAGQTAFFAWANVVLADDLQLRAITLASMNALNAAVNAWWSILLFAAKESPRFTKAAIAVICTAIATAVVGLVIQYLHTRELKLKSNVVVDDIDGEALIDSIQKGGEKTVTEELSSSQS